MSDYEPPMPIMKAVAASISQSTGQNVRKRAEQDGQVQEMHADMVKAVCGRRSDYPEDVFRAYLKRHILEAEARGAAEQRRKDAEAQEPVYQYQYSDQSWCDTSQAEYERNTALDPNDTRILYTHPANVAALEARVKALETEKKQAFNRGYLIACCNVANTHNEPSIACDVLAECSLTEDDVKAADLSEYDANALSEIRKARGDQDPIRAALTREGGV